MNQQCYIVYRADKFARGLLNHRWKLVQAFGGMVIQFTMAYSYAVVLQIGQAEASRRAAPKKGKKNGR